MIDYGQDTLFGSKTISTIGYNEQEIIRDILFIHAKGKIIDCDPTYSIGNFYKKGLPQPKYKFDKTPQIKGCIEATSDNLPLDNESVNTIMFDPPFVFGIHGKAEQNIMAERFSIFKNFDELRTMYEGSLKEFYRILKPKGIVIFKCQDYTDSKTTMTHCLVYNWAIDNGFYAKDLFILFSKQRVFNPNLQQRHARKFHSYFLVFEKTKCKVDYDIQQTSLF